MFSLQQVDADMVVSMNANQNTGTSTACNDGFTLLSCGMRPVDLFNEEIIQHIFPTSSGTCDCYSAFLKTCQAWCASAYAVRGIEYITTAQQKGTSRAVCPAGKKVVGCHISPGISEYRIAGGTFDQFRYFYPSNESTCTCYDSTSASCTASCASNIINHEIIAVNGTGPVPAICPRGKIVLGCGRVPWTVNRDRFRQLYITGYPPHCLCKDDYGTACYAICGNFA